MCGTPVASKTMEESSILSTPAKGLFMQTVNEIVAEEIAKELENVELSIKDLRDKLAFAEKRKEKLLVQAACKDHDWVSEPFPFIYCTDTCSKCGRDYIF